MTPRPASLPAPGHSPFQLTDYLRMIYRRRWTASLVLLVVFSYGAFSTLRKTPIYEGVANIQIEKDARRATSLNSVLNESDNYYDEEFYNTQYRVLQSRALAWRAVEKLGLKPGAPPPSAAANPGLVENVRAWVQKVIGAPPKIAPPPPDESTVQAAMTNAFLAGLIPVPVKNTHIVEIHYRSPDPQFAADAANAVAAAYIAQTMQSRVSASKEANDYLDQQLTDARQKLAASEKALQDYKERNDAVGVDDRQNMIVQGQADLNGKLVAAKTDRIDKQTRYDQLNKLLGDSNRAGLEAFPAVSNSEVVSKLKTQEIDLRQKRADAAQRYVDGSPQLVQIDRDIKANTDKLNQEIARIAESVKTEYLQAKGKEDELQRAFDQQSLEANRLSRKGVDYAQLVAERDANKTLLNDLLERSNDSGVASEFRGSNIKILDKAEISRAPILPNTSRDLFVAFLMGCVLAVGLAFGIEYLDSRIRTPEEIKLHLGIPFLGLVPALEKTADGKSPLLSGTVPPAFSEAMRGIRTAVVFSSAEDGARTIVVTSTAPSEGKTLISTNLAVALAQAEQRTLIIDGDMRRPRVHEVFEHLQEPGLSNVLVGTTELHSAICRTTVPNLYVLSAGHIPPNPAELLGSARYREVIQDLRHQFDWILIDAPPVMAVTDAAVVATSATGVVFVVGSEMTSRRHAAFAVEQLSAVNARFIGAVLNRADVQRHGYYYSTYYRKDYTQAYTRTS